MDLFRLKSVRAWTVLLSGAMALAACGGGSDAKDNGNPPVGGDGGMDGMDVEETGMDVVTGMDRPDAGRTDGPPVGTDRPDPCPNGSEGCECTSTATAAAVPFRQEDCQAGLRCVPWDLISGLRIGGANPQLDAPVKTCVKPCQNDGECGSNRRCAAIGFTEATEAAKICVDKLVSYDEICSGSRLAVEQISDPATTDHETQMAACEDGLDCQLFLFGDFFNPDESVCIKDCIADADCTRPDLPYCNPRFFTSTSTTNPFIGVCTDGPHPHGAICGSTDPDKDFRISTGCDTSEATCGTNADACPVCVGINLDANNSLTPTGQGICMSPCNNTTPCVDMRTCVPMFFQSGDGVCSDGCTALPETCPGQGSLSNGQDCLELQGGASFCIDRYTPAHAPSQWSAMTGMITVPGDDCVGDLNNYSFFRCPDGSSCVPTDQQGFCIYGCKAGDPTQGTSLCQTLLNTMTATCTEPQAGFGVCAM